MSEMAARVGKAVMDRIAEYGIRLSGPIQEDIGKIAIAAMREPTDEMKAGEDIHWEWPGCGVCGGLREGWYAMIDEALK